MKYKVWYQKNNRIEKTICDDSSIPNNVIKKQAINEKKSLKRINIAELFFEMNIMLEAKLSFKDTINILIKSNSSYEILKLLNLIKMSIINGKPIYKTLMFYERRFGLLPILFFRFAQESGDMRGSIKALCEILSEFDIIKEKIVNSLKYPLVLFITLIISMCIIFIFVIPKFEHIFLELDSDLPTITKILLHVKGFFETYILQIILLFISIGVLSFYSLRSYIIYFDRFLFYNIPFLSNIYQKVMMYKLFSSLYFMYSSKLQFHDALKNSILIVENRFFEEKLYRIFYDINNGSTISNAFKESGIFDESIIRLLLSGEKSNRLEDTLKNIKNINKKRLEKSIDTFTSLIAPILIFFMAFSVLWIVLAIMTPIWELNNLVN